MKKKAVKLLSILLAAALLIGASIGGTLAYLSAKSDTVVNTFTVGNINITLKETGAKETGTDTGIFAKSLKMVPGNDIAKDPTVTVEGGSEDCYLFVKITEGDEAAKLIATTSNKDNNGGTYITYDVATGWTAVDGEDSVYYRTVSADTEDQHFYILSAGDAAKGLEKGYVHVEETVTKAMMDNDTNVGELSLTFTAYAVQKDNLSLVQAWGQAKALDQ